MKKLNQNELLIRIDERVGDIKEDITEINNHLKKLNGKVSANARLSESNKSKIQILSLVIFSLTITLAVKLIIG